MSKNKNSEWIDLRDLRFVLFVIFVFSKPNMEFAIEGKSEMPFVEDARIVCPYLSIALLFPIKRRVKRRMNRFTLLKIQWLSNVSAYLMAILRYALIP